MEWFNSRIEEDDTKSSKRDCKYQENNESWNARYNAGLNNNFTRIIIITSKFKIKWKIRLP